MYFSPQFASFLCHVVLRSAVLYGFLLCVPVSFDECTPWFVFSLNHCGLFNFSSAKIKTHFSESKFRVMHIGPKTSLSQPFTYKTVPTHTLSLNVKVIKAIFEPPGQLLSSYFEQALGQ